MLLFLLLGKCFSGNTAKKMYVLMGERMKSITCGILHPQPAVLKFDWRAKMRLAGVEEAEQNLERKSAQNHLQQVGGDPRRAEGQREH